VIRDRICLWRPCQAIFDLLAPLRHLAPALRADASTRAEFFSAKWPMLADERAHVNPTSSRSRKTDRRAKNRA